MASAPPEPAAVSPDSDILRLVRPRIQLALLAVPAAVLMAPGAVAGAPVPTLRIRDASVSPRRAYFAGAPVRIAFALDAASPPLALRVDIVREATREPVRHFDLPAAKPSTVEHVMWDGVTGGGEVAPNGTYRVRLTAPSGAARNAGTFILHSHIYPIQGRHVDRGPIGRFGAPRDGGRTHEGYDVNAACGTRLVAARGGTVVRSTYDPVLYGNLVIIHGERTERDYWYAHMLHPSPLHTGDSVRTGQPIGRVGKTGNARTIGCHLHFEIRKRGVPIDPEPALHAWDAWS
jgi:murein DD-endopeptidase MepM/ murein hydrolase activator NlpD